MFRTTPRSAIGVCFFSSLVAVSAVMVPAIARATDPSQVPCDGGSLRSAVQTVADAGGTLSLASGCTYTFAATDNTTDGPNALPVITGSVTIIGNGATIARDPAAPAFRLFTVDGAGALALQDLTLQGGTIPSSETQGGGAVLNRSVLDVTGVTFRDNSSAAATGGGAILNHDLGRLRVATSTFVGNIGLQGGAIENDGTYCDTSQPVCADVTVGDSTFQGNSTTGFGGGAIETQLSPGGALPSCPPPSPGQCEMPGGAVTTLVRDTFTGNTAETEGGAIANFGTTTVSDSTITGNTTNAANDRYGGGGIQNTAQLTVESTTLAGNTSAYGANLHTYHDVADGLPAPVTTLSSTLVAALGAAGSSCGGEDPVTDGGYNLDSGTSCGFDVANHSLSNTDPKLGSLAANGGPTQTMALDPASPAVDAIPAGTSGCQGTTDQRGTPRPSGTGCDIGAFELTPADVPAPPPPAAPPSAAPPAPNGSSPSGSTCASTRFVAVWRAPGVHAGRGVRRAHTSIGMGLLARAKGATITITCKAGQLDLIFRAGPQGGRARLTIGRRNRTIDLYAPTQRECRITLTLPGEEHVARLVALGTHRSGSRGTQMLLMAMRMRVG